MLVIGLDSADPGLLEAWIDSGELATDAAVLLHGRASTHAGRRFRLFFPLPNGEQSGAIRLNLVGRESHGLVRPGPEREALCDYLISALNELADPDSGTPIVESVWRTEEVFSGPHNERLPDLFVEWRRDRPILGSTP